MCGIYVDVLQNMCSLMADFISIKIFILSNNKDKKIMSCIACILMFPCRLSKSMTSSHLGTKYMVEITFY